MEQEVFDMKQLAGRGRLLDIGRVLATDTFINFHRRFPLLWEIPKARGLENLVFQVLKDELGGLYVVGSYCNCFKYEADSMIQYLNKLEKFLNDLFIDCKTIMQGDIDIKTYTFLSLKNIRGFMSKKIELDEMQCLEIVYGIVVGYYNIVKMGMERVRRMFNRARNLAVLENRKNWKKQAEDNIDLLYLKEAYELINHYLHLNPQVLEWVLKASYSFKVITSFDSENEEEDKNYIAIDKGFILNSHEDSEEEIVEPQPVEPQPVEENVVIEVKKETVESVKEESIQELQEIPVVSKSCCCLLL